MIKEHVISKLITTSTCRYSFNIFTYVAPTINLSLTSSTVILSTKAPFEGKLTQSREKKSTSIVQ